MLRSLLVALDGSATSIQAGRMALALAKRCGAHVEGVGILNSEAIALPEPVPPGGAAFKAGMDARAVARASAGVEATLDSFRQAAVDAGVESVHIRSAEGDPREILQEAATAHDLIVVGRNSMFDARTDLYAFPLSVDQIIRREPRPVLLMPEPPEGSERALLDGPVLIAFDGSPAASRTLHIFALLALAADRPVHVLTLDTRSARAAREAAEQACMLLRRHGAAEARPIGLGDGEAGTAAEAILGTAKAVDAGLIAMGAYGHHGIREIFGSCTRAVLRACPVPLFLHH